MKKLLFLLLLLISPVVVLAQSSNADYAEGVIVNAAGDTVPVQIRVVKDHLYLRSVTVVTDADDTPVKYTPKEIRYFRFNDREFVSITLDGKKVFMERVIGGEITLLKSYRRERKGGKNVTVESYYVQKGPDGALVEIDKNSFRRIMTEMVKDYTELAGKIDDRYYTYAEKEAVVEDYNQWVKLGKPGTKWTKENGNFTIKDDEPVQQPVNRRKYDRDRYGPRFGIDITGLATYNFVNFPDQLAVVGIIPGNGGFGFNTGVGFRAKLTPALNVRAGFSGMNKRFVASFVAIDPDTNYYNAVERGSLYYLGMYGMVEYEMGRFVVSAGFNFTFHTIYRANYRHTNQQSGVVIDGNEEVDQSLLAKSFDNQFDFIFGFGYKIPAFNQKVIFKPTFQYTLPIRPLWSDWGPGLEQLGFYGYNISGFSVQLGLIIDFGI